MDQKRKDVIRLTNELHRMREELEEDLNLLVDDDLVNEMKKLGIV